MYQNKIKELPKLNPENYENIFQVYTDEDDRYYYNLLQSVNIPTDLPNGYYNEYVVKYNDTWPLISYKNYETPNLWWIIVAVNKITNPVDQPIQGQIIKILKPTFVSNILLEIKNQTR